ncbi:MAG: arsenate reductase [Patescibacteria group bacterium]|jgi:arsenate reductase
MKIYSNPRCAKCRTAVKFLEDNNIKATIIEHLNEGINRKDIVEILKKGNYNIDEIIRKNEDEYKKYIKGKDLTDEEKADILEMQPKLLQRPIIVDKKTAKITREKDVLKKYLTEEI